MLACLQGLHDAGYIHRDVKPANFVVWPRDQPAEAAQWKAIDFGLTRRFIAEDGSIIPERATHEFRGSTAYASVNSHQKQDLGALCACSSHCCNCLGRLYACFHASLGLWSRHWLSLSEL